MSTKPEQHEVVRAFAKSLKPPIRLSLPALETLAVIAYKQPFTVPEINDIRGVDSGGVIGTLLDRKLITTAGRKQVIGRPILYKTTKEFLMRFGLKDVNELPSMEEFEKLVAESFQAELIPAESAAAEVPTAAASEASDAESSSEVSEAEKEAS
jgi:segregation and condensation protein B